MDKRVWQENIVSDLERLSDSSFQTACFSGEIESAYSSPGEMISSIYDDALLVDFVRECLDGELQEVGRSLINAIDVLADLVNLSSDDWLSIVQSDAWKRMMLAAHHLLQRISMKPL